MRGIVSNNLNISGQLEIGFRSKKRVLNILNDLCQGHHAVALVNLVVGKVAVAHIWHGTTELKTRDRDSGVERGRFKGRPCKNGHSISKVEL